MHIYAAAYGNGVRTMGEGRYGHVTVLPAHQSGPSPEAGIW